MGVVKRGVRKVVGVVKKRRNNVARITGEGRRESDQRDRKERKKVISVVNEGRKKFSGRDMGGGEKRR